MGGPAGGGPRRGSGLPLAIVRRVGAAGGGRRLEGGGWLVDPCSGGQRRRVGPPTAEPLGASQEGGVEGGRSPGVNLDCGAVVDGRGGMHCDPGMAVLVIVVAEGLGAESA